MLHTVFKRNMAPFLILLTCFSPLLYTDQLVLDRNFSPHASSYDMIFLENSVIDAQNKYKDDHHNFFINPLKQKEALAQDPELLKRPYYQYTGRMRRLKAGLRLAELLFFWSTLNMTAGVTQHEVFGHGYRIRDLGKNVAVVKSYLVTPFSGSTSFVFKQTPTLSEKLLINIGGVEADAILGNNICLSWLENNLIDGRQASLTLQALNSLPGYIATIRDFHYYGGTPDGRPNDIRYLEGIANNGHDIANYLLDLNKLYQPQADPSLMSLEEQLTELKLKGCLSVLLNPFNYFSYQAMYSYFWYNSAIEVPTINFGSFKYLPAYSLGLTPFGPENIYKNYVMIEGFSPFYLYFKEGQFANHKYFGCGVENQAIVKSEYGIFGFKCDFWSQPPLALSGKPVFSLSDKLGTALSLIYRHSILNQENQSVFCQLGFKTSGYLPGESIFAAPIIRAGVKLKF